MPTLKTKPQRGTGENYIAYLLRANDERDLKARGWNVQEMKDYAKREEQRNAKAR